MELDLKRETSQGVQSLKNDLNRLNIEHKKLASETKEELKHYSLTQVGYVKQEIEKSNSDQKSLQARIQHLQETLSTLNVEIRDIKDT
jgi:chromosome segregation ATPase